MKTIIPNNVSSVQILSSFATFELFYEQNKLLFSEFKQSNIMEDSCDIIYRLQNINQIPLNHFYIDIHVKRFITEKRIQYTITNNNDSIHNIQLLTGLIDIYLIDVDQLQIEVQCSIDETIYPKPIVQLFNRIAEKLFIKCIMYLEHK